MSKREEALSHIVALADTYALTPRDISEAMAAHAPQKSAGIAMRLFAYLGGVFIFAGICAYVSMFWPQMNSYTRVLVTLGPGVLLFALAVAAHGRAQYNKIIPPFLVLAAVLQPTGLFTFANEFSMPLQQMRHIGLVIFAVMLTQQLLAFIKTRHAMLLCTSLAFGLLFFGTAFDLLEVSNKLSMMILGLSLLCITYSLDRTPLREITGFWYFIGAAMFLLGGFESLRGTPVELLYIGIACFMIYLSVLTQSASLLVVSIGAMLSYIGYYTYQHFVNSVSWPILLVTLGVIFFAVSAGAVRIKQKYLHRRVTNENPT